MKPSVMFNPLIIICLLTTPVLAENIEVFLTHKTELLGVTEAQENGHTIQYHYLDGVEQLEEKLAQKATQQYQQQINALVKKEGLKKLSQMSDSQRAMLFQQHLEGLGIRLPSFSQLLTPQDQEKMQWALADLRYAQDQSVDVNLLPSVVFQGQLYPDIQDLGDL